MFLLEMYCSTPVGRYARHWYGGLVRCAKLFTISSGFKKSVFCWPFLFVTQATFKGFIYTPGPVPCTHGFECSRWVKLIQEDAWKYQLHFIRFESTFPLISRHFGRASLRLSHAAGSHRCENAIIWSISSCSVADDKPSLAYSLTLRSPWAVTGEENHVLHNYHRSILIVAYHLNVLQTTFSGSTKHVDALWTARLLKVHLSPPSMTAHVEWWPTQLSWNFNDENFVPKPLTWPDDLCQYKPFNNIVLFKYGHFRRRSC